MLDLTTRQENKLSVSALWHLMADLNSGQRATTRQERISTSVKNFIHYDYWLFVWFYFQTSIHTYLFLVTPMLGPPLSWQPLPQAMLSGHLVTARISINVGTWFPVAHKSKILTSKASDSCSCGDEKILHSADTFG